MNIQDHTIILQYMWATVVIQSKMVRLGYIARSCIKSFLDIKILKKYICQNPSIQPYLSLDLRNFIHQPEFRRNVPMFMMYIYDIDPISHELDLSRRHIVYIVAPKYTEYRQSDNGVEEKYVASTDSYEFHSNSYKSIRVNPVGYIYENDAQKDARLLQSEYFNNTHSTQDEFLYSMTQYNCPKCKESVKQICTISQKHCCKPENHDNTPCKMSKCVPISKIIDLDRMIPKTDLPWSRSAALRDIHKIGDEYVIFGKSPLPLIHEYEHPINFLDYIPTLALDIETITVDKNYKLLPKTQFIAISLIWYDGKGNITDSCYVGSNLPNLTDYPDQFTKLDNDDYYLVHFPSEHKRDPIKCKFKNCKNEFEVISETLKAVVTGPLYDGILTYNGEEFEFPNFFTIAHRYNIDFQGILLHANPEYVNTPDMQLFQQHKDRLSKYKAGQFIRDLNVSHEALPNCVSIDLYRKSGMLSLKAYSTNMLKLPYTKLDLPHEQIPISYYAQDPNLIVYCITDTALCGDLFNNKVVREINLDSCYLIEALVCYNWDNIIQDKKKLHRQSFQLCKIHE